MFKTLIPLAMIILAIGCVSQPAENKSVMIDNVEYFFTFDIEKAKSVPAYYAEPVRLKMLQSSKINVIFDCSEPENKPSYTVAAFNAVSILQNYFVYSHGRYASFETFCFIGNEWFNSTNEPVASPSFVDTNLWFRISNETSIQLSQNNTIIIQGTDHGNLILATDAFSLTVLGVKK